MNITATETNIETIATNTTDSASKLTTIDIDTGNISSNTSSSNTKLDTVNTTLSSISGKLPSALGNNASTDSLAVNMASDDTLKTQNFNVRKAMEQTNDRTYEIMGIFSDFTASTITNQSDQVKSTGLTFSHPVNAELLDFCSSNASDNGKQFKIVGFNTTGTYQTEIVTLDAVNAQIPVSTATNYNGLTNVTYYNVPSTLAGNVYIVRSGDAITAGVPDSTVFSVILSGSSYNASYFTNILIPTGKKLIIYEIELSHVGSTINTQKVEFIKTRILSTGTTYLSQASMLLNSWMLTSNNPYILSKYDGGFIVDKLRTVQEFVYFRVNGITTSATDSIQVRCRFSFVDTS